MVFLKILAVLLLVLLILLLIGLTIKTGVQVFWKEKGFILKIKLGQLSLQMYPWKIKIKTKTKKSEPEKKKKTKVKESGLNLENLDLRRTLEFTFRFLGELRGTVTIERLQFILIVAGTDAAKTALRYGRIWQIAGVLQPFLNNCFPVIYQKIEITCDFDRKKMAPDVELFFYTRPIRILRVIWKERKELWNLYQALTKKEEITYVQSSHS